MGVDGYCCICVCTLKEFVCMWEIIEFLFLLFNCLILMGLRTRGQLKMKQQILGLVHLCILKIFLKDSMLVIYF